MTTTQKNNPLHGISLKTMLTELVRDYGWEELSGQIDIRCFKFDPSINSSLKFLRATPWARAKLEELYLISLAADATIEHTNSASPDLPTMHKNIGTL
jgi:uncharacterized protein (DUF2132 family)